MCEREEEIQVKGKAREPHAPAGWAAPTRRPRAQDVPEQGSTPPFSLSSCPRLPPTLHPDAAPHSEQQTLISFAQVPWALLRLSLPLG
jgi:hypothetical protein